MYGTLGELEVPMLRRSQNDDGQLKFKNKNKNKH